MTCSIHKFGEYFPGTGTQEDKGKGKGKGYAVNIPLKDGITDESYRSVFDPVSFRDSLMIMEQVNSLWPQGHWKDTGEIHTVSGSATMWCGLPRRRQTWLLQPNYARSCLLRPILPQAGYTAHNPRWGRLHSKECCADVDVRDCLCARYRRSAR